MYYLSRNSAKKYEDVGSTMLNNAFGGVLFLLLLFTSSYFGTIFYMFPCLPILFVAPKTGRLILEGWVGLWEHFSVAILEFVVGTKIVITGDSIRPGEWSLLLMNHRTRLDWLFFWSVLIRFIPMRSLKVILKAGLEMVPGAGWAMQLGRYIFLKRSWAEDKFMLSETFDYMMSGSSTYQILLFPEGTDFRPESLAKSDQFAVANGLPKFEYVLHPRMTGFLYIVDKMRQGNCLDAVYDITVGYPINTPQGELNIAKGDFPRALHFHIDRYSAGSIPHSADKLSQWCLDLWVQKEQRLKDFYKTGDFSRLAPRADACSISGYLYILYLFSLVFWVATVVYSFVLVYKHVVVLIYVVIVSLFFLIVGRVFGGLNKLELKLVKMRNEKFSSVKPKK